VIGGLAGKSHNRQDSGIPVLSRIPLIGALLFGRTTINEETSELYLFLTPHIISTDADMDKLREAVRDGSELLQKVNVDPRIVPKTDTLPPFRRDTLLKRDTTRKPDSLTTLRRRPPVDSASLPIHLEPIAAPPAKR